MIPTLFDITDGAYFFLSRTLPQPPALSAFRSFQQVAAQSRGSVFPSPGGAVLAGLLTGPPNSIRGFRDLPPRVLSSAFIRSLCSRVPLYFESIYCLVVVGESSSAFDPTH